MRVIDIFRRAEGEVMLVYRCYSKPNAVMVATSRALSNWDTYGLKMKLPFHQPLAAHLKGDKLILIRAAEEAAGRAKVFDLREELTAESRQDPVIDDKGNRLPSTARLPGRHRR